MANFINEEIKNKLILDFGMGNTIQFCEMASIMFDMMEKDLINRGFSNEQLYEFGYGYDSKWWKIKYNELTKRKDERNNYNGIIS